MAAAVAAQWMVLVAVVVAAVVLLCFFAGSLSLHWHVQACRSGSLEADMSCGLKSFGVVCSGVLRANCFMPLSSQPSHGLSTLTRDVLFDSQSFREICGHFSHDLDSLQQHAPDD